ncbi:MAG: serine/threonine protein kinase [Myxococcales bacterium]|nr:serine/threonine protein kinase [Myxococcales bacterium]
MAIDRAGTVIAGKYKLQELAGRGGMASVWRGFTLGAAGFRRPVAIKRILPGLEEDRQFLTMFVEEARVGAELLHPNIVQIHDFGEDEAGRYFLVMEWIEGLDLGRLLRAYGLVNAHTPWPLISAITIEVLRGIGAAHERGRGPVIHRDINPQNILVGMGGVVKVTDFGLSRAADRGRITNPDIVKGKLSYLAPELTLGADPSVQSDLFSVGVVLWEALAGRKLFTGQDDVELVLGVRAAEIPSLAAQRPGLPDALYRIVHRALEREPGARFADADEMARALASLLRSINRRTDARVIARAAVTARRRLRQRSATAPPPVPEQSRPPLRIPLDGSLDGTSRGARRGGAAASQTDSDANTPIAAARTGPQQPLPEEGDGYED